MGADGFHRVMGSGWLLPGNRGRQHTQILPLAWTPSPAPGLSSSSLSPGSPRKYFWVRAEGFLVVPVGTLLPVSVAWTRTCLHGSDDTG